MKIRLIGRETFINGDRKEINTKRILSSGQIWSVLTSIHPIASGPPTKMNIDANWNLFCCQFINWSVLFSCFFSSSCCTGVPHHKQQRANHFWIIWEVKGGGSSRLFQNSIFCPILTLCELILTGPHQFHCMFRLSLYWYWSHHLYVFLFVFLPYCQTYLKWSLRVCWWEVMDL